jgi:hypothetical protein
MGDRFEARPVGGKTITNICSKHTQSLVCVILVRIIMVKSRRHGHFWGSRDTVKRVSSSAIVYFCRYHKSWKEFPALMMVY